MQEKLRTKDLRGSEATRQALIDAGERLYAQHGVHGTNLLAIAREAGQANKYAVQYHFGDQEGLLRAILDSRAVWLEKERAQRLAALPAAGGLTDLLGVVMLPLADLVDAEGKRAYARFLLQFMTQLEPWPHVRHPLREKNPDYPTIGEVRRILIARLPHLERETLLRRLDWLFRGFLGVLVDFENRPEARRAAETLHSHIEDYLNICVASLKACCRGEEHPNWPAGA